jgi:hypothetical protein
MNDGGMFSEWTIPLLNLVIAADIALLVMAWRIRKKVKALFREIARFNDEFERLKRIAGDS